jgi:hypothetical protein
MTNPNKTLIINLDGNDALTFMPEGKTFANKGTVTLNDARDGEGTANVSYDVYSDGNVTLLIHDASNAATVTGLPA